VVLVVAELSGALTVAPLEVSIFFPMPMIAIVAKIENAQTE
jgi:hypothetical protein